MFSFLCKRRVPQNASAAFSIRNSIKTQLGFLQTMNTVIPNCSSSCRKTEKSSKAESFTVSYLINSCGLSPEVAISRARMVQFQSSDRPNSVLALLKDYGFDKTQIAKFVTKRPLLLISDPEKILLPKLEFYRSIGFLGADLPKKLSMNPSMLMYSLKNRLIPWSDFLKSVLIFDQKVLTTFKSHSLMFLCYDVNKDVATNLAALRQLGVPQRSISILISLYPLVVCKRSDKFNKDVMKVIEMGFNCLTATFVQALSMIGGISKERFKHKIEVCKRCGLSDNEFQAAFKIYPRFVGCSEKKITSVVDFLVNRMGFLPATIFESPILFSYSLEKRIVPRCLVVRSLQLKGLIKKDSRLLGFLPKTEKRFLERYVMKYKEEVPELLCVYQGKVGLLESGFGT